MPLILPVNYFNSRFVFQSDFITKEVGFSIASAPALGVTAGDRSLDWTTTAASAGFFVLADVSQDWRWDRVDTTLMTGSGPLIGSVSTNLSGTGTYQSTIQNSALLVNKATAVGGRKNRGRLYVPPFQVVEGSVNAGGFLSGTQQSDLQAIWTAMFTEAGVNGIVPVLLHTSPADTPTEITDFVVQSQMATQRLRMR